MRKWAHTLDVCVFDDSIDTDGEAGLQLTWIVTGTSELLRDARVTEHLPDPLAGVGGMSAIGR